MGPMHYEIRVLGHLDGLWADWFDNLTIENQPYGEAVLSGSIPDQSALHGVLIKIRDLGLTLVSVRQIEATQQDSKPTP